MSVCFALCTLFDCLFVCHLRCVYVQIKVTALEVTCFLAAVSPALGVRLAHPSHRIVSRLTHFVMVPVLHNTADAIVLLCRRTAAGMFAQYA
jgi:hypothetical protein